MSDYELYHHGVKGQRWGVIRERASSLGRKVAPKLKTAAKKTGQFASKQAAKAKKTATAKAQKAARDYKEKTYYKKLHHKRVADMTDKELVDYTNRIKKEAALKDAKYEKRMQNGRKFYNTVAKQPVNTFFSTYTQKAVERAFNKK